MNNELIFELNRDLIKEKEMKKSLDIYKNEDVESEFFGNCSTKTAFFNSLFSLLYCWSFFYFSFINIDKNFLNFNTDQEIKVVFLTILFSYLLIHVFKNFFVKKDTGILILGPSFYFFMVSLPSMIFFIVSVFYFFDIFNSSNMQYNLECLFVYFMIVSLLSCLLRVMDFVDRIEKSSKSNFSKKSATEIKDEYIALCNENTSLVNRILKNRDLILNDDNLVLLIIEKFEIREEKESVKEVYDFLVDDFVKIQAEKEEAKNKFNSLKKNIKKENEINVKIMIG